MSKKGNIKEYISIFIIVHGYNCKEIDRLVVVKKTNKYYFYLNSDKIHETNALLQFNE